LRLHKLFAGLKQRHLAWLCCFGKYSRSRNPFERFTSTLR
jgi:hypothetical protein